MNSDHYYRIGSMHHFCEDYATSAFGKPNKPGYAVVSDGCSSAKDSQIGAMLMAISAEQFLYPCLKTKEFVNLAINAADIRRCALGLDADALSATLLTVIVTPTSFFVTVTGDGVVVARHRERGLTWKSLEYESGAPYYARYGLYSRDVEQYLALFPGKFTIRSEHGDLCEGDTGPDYGATTHFFEYGFDEYDMVGVMSDGARSFFRKEITGSRVSSIPIDVSEIVNEMFSFKNINGEFVKRRCQKAFKTFEEAGWHNSDDFSIGVVVND